MALGAQSAQMSCDLQGFVGSEARPRWQIWSIRQPGVSGCAEFGKSSPIRAMFVSIAFVAITGPVNLLPCALARASRVIGDQRGAWGVYS